MTTLLAILVLVALAFGLVLLCVVELVRALVRGPLVGMLAGAILLGGCSHCLEETHRNDLACWLRDEIISCSEDAIVPEVTPLVIALLPAITGAGGIDWGKIESQLLSMGIRDGGCLLAALEQRFSQPQASPGLRAEAPAVAGLRRRLWPRTGYKMADGTVLK